MRYPKLAVLREVFGQFRYDCEWGCGSGLQDPHEPVLRERFARRCRRRAIPLKFGRRYFDLRWPAVARRILERRRKDDVAEQVADEVDSLLRAGALGRDWRDPAAAQYAIDRMLSERLTEKEARRIWAERVRDYARSDMVRIILSNGKAVEAVPYSPREGIEEIAEGILEAAAGRPENGARAPEDAVVAEAIDAEIFEFVDALRRSERAALRMLLRHFVDRRQQEAV